MRALTGGKEKSGQAVCGVEVQRQCAWQKEWACMSEPQEAGGKQHGTIFL